MGSEGFGDNARTLPTLHLLASLFLLSACGGAEPPSPPAMIPGPAGGDDDKHEGEKAPDLGPAERERHIEDALREVDAAERALDQNLKTRTPGRDPAPVPGPGPGAEPSTGCETACQALTSMQRAAAYVCKLAGDADARCRTAEGRVRAARTKVERAACSCPEPVARDERLQPFCELSITSPRKFDIK